MILWAIILAFIAEVALMVVCLSIVLPKMTFSSDCLVASAPGLFMSYWYVHYEVRMRFAWSYVSVTAQDVLSRIRDVLVRVDLDQVLPEHFAKQVIGDLHLCERRYLGIRAYIWYVRMLS